MDLSPFVESLRRDLVATASFAGDDARAAAERLLGALDASVRLVLIDVLSAAAEEITAEVAPGSVEIRLRNREPEFVVSMAPPAPPVPPAPPPPPLFEADDGTTARISLRLSDALKARVEEAASGVGASVNAYLVRALNDAVNDAHHRAGRKPSSDHRPGRSLSGWVR